MSRSYWKSTTDKSRFDNFVSYFSNKKSRTEANQSFRTKNKQHLKMLEYFLKTSKSYIQEDDYDDLPNIETTFLNKLKECSDVWDFASDGLKEYFERHENCSDADWKKYYKCK